ncbi:MAG: integrase core domain-containing protein [Thermodesulfobacteriota bacterium]
MVFQVFTSKKNHRQLLKSAGIKPIRLPPQSPNLNAYSERWVRSVKEECLSKLIPFGERSLENALSEYLAHYHEERNHQGKENRILFPKDPNVPNPNAGEIACRTRLNGVLTYYYRSKIPETDGFSPCFSSQPTVLEA